MNTLKKLGVAGLLMLAACSEWKTGGNIGGANQGARAAGNRQGGISLADGDVAVSPSGKFFVTLEGGSLVTGDVGASKGTRLTNLPTPERVAFWTTADKEGLFILAKDGDSQRVLSWSRADNAVVWDRTLARKDKFLDVTPDGTRVLLAGVDILLADAATGAEVGTHVVATTAVRDVDISKDGMRAIITHETSWEGGSPQTLVSVRNTQDGTTTCEVTADNCADELVMSGDEAHAFLAPTLCQKDPVTVLALNGEHCSVAKQMPGFGPVALSGDGKTAVAFLDRDAAEAPGFPAVPANVKSSKERYHFMVINTDTLSFETHPAGDTMPRYAFTPTGKEMLVDMPMDLTKGVSILDVATGALRNVSGPALKLDSFTLSPDGLKAFVAGQGLFELDIKAASLRLVPTTFLPGFANITPNGNTLVVPNSAQKAVVFFNPSSGQEENRATF